MFYEAAAVLAAFVLLGHWFEMRARGGANDAIRTLLELAPPMAVAIRRRTAEVPTAEVKVGDLLLIRPGGKIPVDGTVMEGESEVDESMVTGEPAGAQDDRLAGDRRLGETPAPARTRHQGRSDTALAQIVASYSRRRTRAQRLADRAAFWLVLVALRWDGHISGVAGSRPAGHRSTAVRDHRRW